MNDHLKTPFSRLHQYVHCIGPFLLTILYVHFKWPFLNTILKLHQYVHSIGPFWLSIFYVYFEWPFLSTILKLHQYVHCIGPFWLAIVYVHFRWPISTIHNATVYTIGLIIIKFYMFVSSYANVSLGESSTQSLFSEQVIIAPFTILCRVTILPVFKNGHFHHF